MELKLILTRRWGAAQWSFGTPRWTTVRSSAWKESWSARITMTKLTRNGTEHLKLSFEIIWRFHSWGIFRGSFQSSHSGHHAGGSWVHSGRVFQEGHSEGFIQEGLIQEGSLKGIIQGDHSECVIQVVIQEVIQAHWGGGQLRGSSRVGHSMQVLFWTWDVRLLPASNNTIWSKD